MASQVELTPCGAMFDIFKRAAHLSHIELCGLVLSSRPLADGRSPQSRAADRSWVSRFIVRAPVGTLQQRYFAEYGTSAARIMSQLALRQRNPMDSTAVINMVCGPAGEPMVRALEECHQDTNLYRNALDRLSQAAELMPAERAEVVRSLDEAVAAAEEDAFVIGGETVYRALLARCERVYVTKVFAAADADAFFPDLDAAPGWAVEESGPVQEENGLRFQYVTYRQVGE